MKNKFLFAFVLVTVLSLSMMTTASAALPANQSWVKSASNPVVTSAVCAGVATPTDPAIVVESANNYKMYFTTHPGTAGAQIYLATTADGGLTWTCGNSGSPVLTLGGAGAWDEARVIAPTVIKDGTTYRMWYSGRSASAVWAIGYATSSNGISWTKNPGNPVFIKGGSGTWDSEMVRQPSVVKDGGGTFHLFYEGTAKWPYFKIGHATSANGIAWTRDAANPVLSPTPGTWDGNEVYAPSVTMNGAVFEMFYSGNAGGRWMVGHASSSNGTAWVKDNNAIISPATSGWEGGDSTDYAAAVLDSGTWKLFYSGAGSGGYRIGLATLMNQAQLTFRQLGSNVSMGGTTTIYIDVTAVTDLYGYQFQVNYDATKVSATGAFVNSFFDTTGQSIPPTWDASCAAGVCKFAVSKMALATGVSGSGTLAQITFTPLAVGEVALTFSNNILAKLGGATITHSSTVGWVDVNGTATVSGVVALQGRGTPIDAGTVTLYEVSGYAPPVTVSFNPTNGAWSATVAVNPNSATYDIDASHSLYLTNRKTGVVVTHGGSFAQGTTTLLGGDANNDGTISVGDLSCIGGDFGNDPTTSTCGGAGSPDINKDNKTNILDLVLAGGNFNLASPLPW